MRCRNCHEEVWVHHGRWIHSHADHDTECKTGDGSVAYPDGHNYSVTIKTEDLTVTDDTIWAETFSEAEGIAIARFEVEYGDIVSFHEVSIEAEKAS